MAVTKKDGGNAFGAYLNALEKAMGGNVLGAVLVRPQEELSIGPKAKARLQYDRAVAKGRLRPFSLESETATFEGLLCLLRLLQKAEAGEMQLEGKSLSPPEVQELVVQSKVLVGLRLFNFVFSGWPAMELTSCHTVEGPAEVELATAAAGKAKGSIPGEAKGRPKGPDGAGLLGKSLHSGGGEAGERGARPPEPEAWPGSAGIRVLATTESGYSRPQKAEKVDSPFSLFLTSAVPRHASWVFLRGSLSVWATRGFS